MNIFCPVSHGSKSAEDVISLPALAFNNAKAHGGGSLFRPGKLDGKILRHRLSGSLISLVHLMSEGGSFKVKRAGKIVGRKSVKMLFQYGYKAVNGVGRRTVCGAQGTDSVKSAVQYTVAVNYQKLFLLFHFNYHVFH